MNSEFEAIVIYIRSGNYVPAEDAIVHLTGCSRADAVRQVRSVRGMFRLKAPVETQVTIQASQTKKGDTK